MKRRANAIWKGTGLEGSGSLTTQSKAFDGQPYSSKLRFENEDGKQGTNPEELIAAAHAGCFTMALSFQLSGAGYTPDELNTDAVLSLEKKGDGYVIEKIELNLTGSVPGISEDEFMDLAKKAKNGCPVSSVLKCDIELNAKMK